MTDPFDITCTATLRPELFERTISSHVKYLFRQCIERARLIINIDIAGKENSMEQIVAIEEIIKIIDKYPFRSIEMRIGDPPHFPSAFVWCMEQVQSPLFFHLEEDWELVLPIDFEKMNLMFEQYTGLAHLRLSSFVSTDFKCKNWNKFTIWNGNFFEVEQEDKCVIGWAGHPSMNRTKFMKDCLEFIDRSHNPEKQIKGRRGTHPINAIINTSRFGVFHRQNQPKAEIDIGRQWMVEHGYAKAGNKAWFTNWERSKN